MGFRKPVFEGKGIIEIRFESGEVGLYATKEGLKAIIALCSRLIEDDKEIHIHLEDYEILTKQSLRGAIGLFKKG